VEPTKNRNDHETLEIVSNATLAFGGATALAKDLGIAQVAPFGGPLAVSGRDFNLGAMIAFDEINAAGGIGGNRLRLISRDDGYRSADTVQHVSDLLEQDNPLALIGMWGAENIEAVLAKKLLENAGLLKTQACRWWACGLEWQHCARTLTCFMFVPATAMKFSAFWIKFKPQAPAALR